MNMNDWMLLPPLRRFCSHPVRVYGFFFGLCQQDYAKSLELICTQLGGGMGHGQVKSPLKSGAGPDQLLCCLTLVLAEVCALLSSILVVFVICFLDPAQTEVNVPLCYPAVYMGQ